MQLFTSKREEKTYPAPLFLGPRLDFLRCRFPESGKSSTRGRTSPPEFDVWYPITAASELVVVPAGERNWVWSIVRTFGCGTAASAVIADEPQKIYLAPSEAVLPDIESDEEGIELRSLPTPIETLTGLGRQVRVSVAAAEFAKRLRGRSLETETSLEEEPE